MTTNYQHLPTWKQPLACSKSITTSYYTITVKQIRQPNLSTWTDLARTRREEVVIELTDAIGRARRRCLARRRGGGVDPPSQSTDRRSSCAAYLVVEVDPRRRESSRGGKWWREFCRGGDPRYIGRPNWREVTRICPATFSEMRHRSRHLPPLRDAAFTFPASLEPLETVDLAIPSESGRGLL